MLNPVIQTQLTKYFGFFLFLALTAFGGESQAEKLRVIVLTDISNEPDDQMSLVRFLTYSNEFDVEGIIATTSCWRQKDPDISTIHEVIDAYGAAYPNLTAHADGFPTADYLHQIAKRGVDGYGMGVVDGQLDNEAVQLIVAALKKEDPRPIWFSVWGGGNTLGAAVRKLQQEEPDHVEDYVRKIRGYEIALQDDAFAYIAHHFPDVQLISAKLLWKGISKTTPQFGAWSESWGADNSIFDAAWISQNVQNNHGPLGKMYPTADYLWEGDTPSFLYLIPNGLNDPEFPSMGSWGGRFTRQKQANVRSGTGNNTVDGLLDRHRDYQVYSDTHDQWQYQEQTYDNEYCTVFRWRSDFQNDFAARMDWCVASDFKSANHNPTVVLNGDCSANNILRINASIGESLKLSAAGSSDPDDGDELSYAWMLYPEAGTFDGKVSIEAANSESAQLTIVSDRKSDLDSKSDYNHPKTFHVILKVTDSGTPNLVAYRRAILLIN